MDKWTHFCNFVGDDLGIVKQTSFFENWRLNMANFLLHAYHWWYQSLTDGVSIVFGRLCLCHSVIALGGQFTWNWSNVAVNRVLLNAASAVWCPVFFTHHRPHHVSCVRGPENGSLFFLTNSLRHLFWIMSDTTKAVAFGDRYNRDWDRSSLRN